MSFFLAGLLFGSGRHAKLVVLFALGLCRIRKFGFGGRSIQLDELLDAGMLKDEAEIDKAEAAIKSCGRYYLNADTMLKRA